MKSFILLFDIPRENGNLKRWVNRKLNKDNAKMIQKSVWKSKNLNNLMQIASIIKQKGGQSIILKEEVIAPS